MQQTANSSQQFAPRIQGSLYTPNQSFSETIQTPDSQVMDRAEKQAKEHEVAKSRLSDHTFNIREYPDPLLPRQQPASHYYPKGVTAETEKHLLDLIAKLKAGSS
ncbi:hypothetical protein O1611_g6628 [Lasiodiplodia mahajangana]|uniref:Uncharacterized protein n=1 Tax=Lasiodiplodia mahajangana TaxID=1108764 RepID=A0ACC2JHM1_9PEZI|nr:hypothetical protein O1611_g6628 [Lasiodiplodia mahajangana]